MNTLRLDNGGDFTSNEFWDFCEEHGIKREFSVSITPQGNRVVAQEKESCTRNGQNHDE